MNRLLLTLSVLVIIISCMCTDVYAVSPKTAQTDETSPEVNSSGDRGYVNNVLANEKSSDSDYLRAILICLSDIDLYVQFFVTMVFAVGLVYFVILKPIRYFLY